MDYIKLYNKYREVKLEGLWIHYKHLLPLYTALNKTVINNKIIGYSKNKLPIHQISLGRGQIKILLWSQMHGDESTATKVIFDLINYLSSGNQDDKNLVNLLNNCTLIFVPLLNPDGAFLYTRENADKLDINRDAIKLQTAEGKLLNLIVNKIKPDFAFNLHDQDSFYNHQGLNKPATFSFLAPATDNSGYLENSRKIAMSVISTMHNYIKKQIPGQITRYQDSFCSNCFGDMIQKSGYPTILIESGHYPNDEKREITRKYHFAILLNAFFSISSNDLLDYKLYFNIANSEKFFYDIRFDNLLFKNKKTSIAIRFNDKIENGILTKYILEKEVIKGEELKGMYFHKIIDAKGMDYNLISLNNYYKD
jgi:hypothetical protein